MEQGDLVSGLTVHCLPKASQNPPHQAALFDHGMGNPTKPSQRADMLNML